MVTGGAGFIGKTLSNYLVKHKFRVLVLDDLSSGNTKNLAKEVIFCKINILDRSKVENIFKKFKPDIVFHLAAKSSRNSKDIKVLDNIQGTLNIISSCLENPPRKFVFTSSASVYGEASKLPITETSEIKPINNYGMSKAACEGLIETMLGNTNISHAILRLSNVYGPGQRSDNEGGVVSIFCKRIKAGKKLNIYGGGKQTRDFVYVDDVVDALYKSMLSSKSFTANVSTSEETSIKRLSDLVRSVSHKEIDVVYKPYLTSEIKRSTLDNLKIKELINWEPSTSFSEGIELTLND